MLQTTNLKTCSLFLAKKIAFIPETIGEISNNEVGTNTGDIGNEDQPKMILTQCS